MCGFRGLLKSGLHPESIDSRSKLYNTESFGRYATLIAGVSQLLVIPWYNSSYHQIDPSRKPYITDLRLIRRPNTKCETAAPQSISNVIFTAPQHILAKVRYGGIEASNTPREAEKRESIRNVHLRV